MASSRIFIKGLPPTFSEPEFRKHFAQHGRTITDAKIFPNRRIGYIGYKTPEDAQKAVKYFNKTFIRMSKIGVELARPVDESTSVKPTRSAPTSRKDSSTNPAGEASTLKRKRESLTQEQDDPKLKEFMEVMQPKSKKKAWDNIDLEGQRPNGSTHTEIDTAAAVGNEQSDDEYEQVPKKAKREKPADLDPHTDNRPTGAAAEPNAAVEDIVIAEQEEDEIPKPDITDADWARSRTSRLLGLLDDDEEAVEEIRQNEPREDSPSRISTDEKASDQEEPVPTTGPAPNDAKGNDEHAEADLEAVRSSMRLFIRNLPYDVSREDLEAEFIAFGNLEEVHVPLDKKTGQGKGFAYVHFSSPDSAEQALLDRDGQTFQGRLLHILPATARRDNKLDDFALSKLPLKKQHEIKRKREAASSTFNWNALYMNADAVVSNVADRLGLSKSEVLDPTSSDAAVKQAHAETHVIQETKSYFRQQGVDLDSFKGSRRGETAILVKNVPYDCSRDELKRLFEEQGDVKRFLMPPSGIIAIVEFANAAQCKAAFGALAYRKLKSSVLFLEKAPKDLFAAKPVDVASENGLDAVNKISMADLKDAGQVVPETAGTATLFVRNLNFTTTTQLLTETFKLLDGFMSARVKTKTDPKKPGQTLSMGFGFLEFRSAKEAQAALQVMDGYTLEGHKLQIRASHKGTDAAEERRVADAEKKATGQKTKVLIKNLPFEASKKDVRALFGAYGQLRSVRVPKKMDRAARGFAFVDFASVREAQNAIDALRDTHLLGRRLVLDFAAEDPEDAEAEIEKMQQKVGAQVNKVALQKLTSGGRKKFTTQSNDDEG